jgi:outer membrane receptor protein involved in Fe transport
VKRVALHGQQGETPTAGFSVWDLRSAWRPGERLQLVASVENLFDRAYREHLDFRSRGGTSVLQVGLNAYAESELTY